jgi:hypothetical protein
MLLAGAAGIVAALAAYDPLRLFWVHAAGDEPPIRVRNGSYHLELMSGDTGWKEGADENGQPAWAVASGENKGSFVVKVLSSASSNCSQGDEFTGVTRVTLRPSSGQPILIFPGREQLGSAQENRTKVVPRNRQMTWDGKGTLSAADASHRITGVTLQLRGGPVSCDFPREGSDSLVCISSTGVASDCSMAAAR